MFAVLVDAVRLWLCMFKLSSYNFFIFPCCFSLYLGYLNPFSAFRQELFWWNYFHRILINCSNSPLISIIILFRITPGSLAVAYSSFLSSTIFLAWQVYYRRPKPSSPSTIKHTNIHFLLLYRHGVAELSLWHNKVSDVLSEASGIVLLQDWFYNDSLDLHSVF